MIWQDLVFLAGSTLSVAFLYPTLRDASARVPRATSVPSMVIGAVYAMTFFTLGMTFSALGSFAACSMWSLIALIRAPDSGPAGPVTPSIPVGGDVRTLLRRRLDRVRGRHHGRVYTPVDGLN